MRRGFTLVELLVSIGVIALLASIIVPSYSIVRARANSAGCVNNLKALGTALNLYLSDHDMMMPALESARADKNEDVPVIDNTLDKYVEDRRYFICPGGRAIAEKTGTSYYWNSLLGKPVQQSALKLSFFGLNVGEDIESSKIPILVDKEGWHKFTDDKVNHLFADGHVSNQLRLFTN